MDELAADRHPRRRVWLVAAPIAVFSVMGLAAAAFTPVLVRDHPLGLLVLESRNRYLLLVAGKVDVWPFVVIGVLRRFASDPFYFLAGRWYGDRGIEWLTRNATGGGRGVHMVQRFFTRFADAAVLLFPGALVSALAGVSGMSVRRFVTLNLLGSLAMVAAIRVAADAASGPLARLVSWSDDNAGRLTVYFVIGTIMWVVVSGWGGGPPDPRELEETTEDS